MGLDAPAYNEARLGRLAAERAAKGRVLIFRRVITASQALTIPAGIYDVLVLGTGGSGARVTSGVMKATGGGGPGWARDWGKRESAFVANITIGTRAAGTATGNGVAAGNAGGTTSVDGIDDPISITGGQGGNGANSGAAPVLGGLGGVASGGKIRANGSRGGNIDAIATGNHATGGGAVDIFLQGSDATRGGDIRSPATGGPAATGGGGVGGRGGDLTSGNLGNWYSCGGGAGGDALDNVSGQSQGCGPTVTGVRNNGIAPSDAQVIELLNTFPGIAPIGSGSVSSVSPQSGGGGGAYSGALTAVPFGAAGGNLSTGAESLYGGGSGGLASNTGAAVASAPGGAALVIVTVYRETA